jgi:thiosulfate dehydrogenase
MINRWIPFMSRLRKLLLQNEMASFWKAADINLVTDEVLKQELEYGKI